MASDPSPAVIVMARHPQRGRVKTRLAMAIGEAAAEDLYRAFLADLPDVIGRDPRWRLCWYFTPAGAPFRQEVAGRHEAFPQGEGDLGARMKTAIARELQRASAVVVVGTDTPGLDARLVGEAFAALEKGADLVLGPSEDGGYYLIGSRQVPPVFDGVRWGTPTVLTETKRLARDARMRVVELPERYDIDELRDLRRLRQDPILRERPATATAMARIGDRKGP